MVLADFVPLRLLQGSAVHAEPVPHGARAPDVPQAEAVSNDHPVARAWQAGVPNTCSAILMVPAVEFGTQHASTAIA